MVGDCLYDCTELSFLGQAGGFIYKGMEEVEAFEYVLAISISVSVEGG